MGIGAAGNQAGRLTGSGDKAVVKLNPGNQRNPRFMLFEKTKHALSVVEWANQSAFGGLS